MKYVPNALSLSRIPLSVGLFWAAMQENWELASLLFMVALATDALDGWIARRFNVQSKFGGEVLEPVCDLILSVAAIGGLYVGGEIPLSVPIVLVVITALLQISHATPFTRLKRHTYYLHLLFFVGVVLVAGAYYLGVAYGDNSGAIIAYMAVWLTVIVLKWGRVQEWLNGPPATPSA